MDIKGNTLGEKEQIWTKTPYPSKVEEQYGMSSFALNLNVMGPGMEKLVGPTDSRRRPDMRALEHGDMKLAGEEKNRMEVKQR